MINERVKSTKGYLFIETVTPGMVKLLVKRMYWFFMRRYNRLRYIRMGRFSELGYRFRFDHNKPFKVAIGERTIVEVDNIWNTQMGNITVGSNCRFGIGNIMMAPLQIGNGVSTGPRVMVLGPRHPVFGYDYDQEKKTVIGNNVWVSAGSIITFGVTIGDNAIIAVGAVVTKDVPEGAVVAGNPGRNISGVTNELWKIKGTTEKTQK